MHMPASVEIVEVGPRDGLQNEPSMVPTEGKIRLIEALAAAGIRRFEATSFVSPKWIPKLADAEAVLSGLPTADGVVYGGLIPNERGYERARAAGAREVVVIVSATEGHCQANLNRPIAQVLESFGPIAARGRADGVRVRANISTVFGCPFDGAPPLEQVLPIIDKIVAAGIDDVTLSDTIGVGNPRQVHEVFTRVRQAHAGLEPKLGAHFHDTRGLALANVVAALEAGVRTFDASIAGLGGCPFAPGAAGNVATEDLVYLLTEMGIQTGVDLERLLDAADLAEELVGHPRRARLTRSLLAAPSCALPARAPGEQQAQTVAPARV